MAAGEINASGFHNVKSTNSTTNYSVAHTEGHKKPNSIHTARPGAGLVASLKGNSVFA